MYDVLENSEGIVLEGCDITTDDELLTSDGWQRVQELRVRTFMVGFTLYPNNVFYVVRRAMDALADKDQAGERNTERDERDGNGHDLGDGDAVVGLGHQATVDDAETPLHELNEILSWDGTVVGTIGPSCRVCGCSDGDGCSVQSWDDTTKVVVTCHWVEIDTSNCKRLSQL